MGCGRPSSDSRKSSRVRSRTISPFLPYTLASTLTTLTSVENVTSCAARARAPEANNPAAVSSRRRREGRAALEWEVFRTNVPIVEETPRAAYSGYFAELPTVLKGCGGVWPARMMAARSLERSEERRVGEEGRSRWSPYH